MINKLIVSRIIEIIIVITLVLISIPIWQGFEEKISNANVTTLDEYNLTYNIYNEQNLDRIIVSNEYNINKNYKIYLLVDQKLDNDTKIKINNITYQIKDFYSTKEKAKYIYTLINTTIGPSQKTYTISIDPNIKYSYIFEEKTIF